MRVLRIIRGCKQVTGQAIDKTRFVDATFGDVIYISVRADRRVGAAGDVNMCTYEGSVAVLEGALRRIEFIEIK